MSHEVIRPASEQPSEKPSHMQQVEAGSLLSAPAKNTELQLHARWEGDPIPVDLFTYEPSRENVWMYGVDD